MTAHRYWRLLITGPQAVGGAHLDIAEIEMMTSYGGADVCTGGTPFASNSDPSYPASNAFDNTSATTWYTPTSGNLPAHIGYDFGAGNEKDIVEFSMTTWQPSEHPGAVKLQYSDDGVTYTTLMYVNVGAAGTAAGEKRNYRYVPPTGTPHRYWRLLITANNAGAYVGLCDLQLRDPNGINQIVGGTATASSYYTPEALIPSQAVDGSITTAWCSSGATTPSPSTPEWLQYDFGAGEGIVVDHILIRNRYGFGGWAAEQAPKDFKLQWSDDGSSWTDQIAITSQTSWAVYAEHRCFKDSGTQDYAAPEWFCVGAASKTIWRVRSTGPTASDTLALTEISMSLTPGGSDECTGGTPYADSSLEGTPASAFDNSAFGHWACFGSRGWIGYKFASAKDIAEVIIQARNDGWYTQAPAAGQVEYWDGSQWVVAKTFTKTWASAGETHTITVPGHRYWRLYITRNAGTLNAGNEYTGTTEVELRESIGGADATGSGTASASSQNTSPTYTADKAFDNNNSTEWITAAGGTLAPHWLKYDFGSGVEKGIVEVSVRASGTLKHSIRDFDLQWSDDDTNWHTLFKVRDWYLWTAGETKVANADTGYWVGAATGQMWRINVQSQGGWVDATSIAELQFRASKGGANLLTGGTAFASSLYAPDSENSYGANLALDGLTSTYWVGNRPAGEWWAYKFASVVSAIEEVVMTSRAVNAATQSPQDFTIEKWNAETETWDVQWTITGVTGWALEETRTFRNPATATLDLRKMVVEVLRVNHPLDDPTPDYNPGKLDLFHTGEPYEQINTVADDNNSLDTFWLGEGFNSYFFIQDGAAALLDASLTGSGTLAASLTTNILLAAALTGSGTTAAALTTAIRMSTAPAAAGTVTAALTTGINLASQLTASGSLAGDLSTIISMAAGMTGEGTLAASLSVPTGDIAANFTASGTLGADLTTSIKLACAMTCVGSMLPGLVTSIRLQAALQGAGTMVGDLAVRTQFHAALNASGTVAAALTTSIRMASALTAVGTVAPGLLTSIRMAAAPSGSGTVTAALTTSITMRGAFQGQMTFAPGPLRVFFRKIVFKGARLTQVPVGEEGTGLPAATLDNGMIVEDGSGPTLIYKGGRIHERTDEDLIE